VWAYFNHNWLRITRVLISLKLLGLDRESQALFRWLDDAWTLRRFPIPANTYQHWKNASAAVTPG
jgi:hypothetical protein